MNDGHLYFNKMGYPLLFPIEVHINESYITNTLSFIEVANSLGVHTKMNMSKEKVINVHIKNGKIIHFKACAEGLFYTNLNEPTTITNLTKVSLNIHPCLSTVKQSSYFLLILKLKERRKFESYGNIFTGRELKILIFAYKKE